MKTSQTLILIIFLLLCAMGIESSLQAEELRLDQSQALSDQEEQKQHVNRFFEQCLKRPIIHENQDTDFAFCSCTAAHLQTWFNTPTNKDSTPFLGDLVSRAPSATDLLINIYAPCLYIPIHDRAYDDCLYGSKKHYFADEPYKHQGFCECLAKGESDYFKNFAQPFLELKTAQNKEVIDPIEDIKRDTNYYDAHYIMEGNCYVEWTNKK